MKLKIFFFICLIMIGKAVFDYFHHPFSAQNKNIQRKIGFNPSLNIEKKTILSEQFDTHLKSLVSLTLEEDYQKILSSMKNELNQTSAQKEFIHYYKEKMNQNLGLAEIFLLNKVLVSVPHYVSTAKELMKENAYNKNNPFATYDVHLGLRPSEKFNLGRAHLLELIKKNLSPSQVLQLIPELESLIQNEQNIVIVREAIKTWVYAQGKTPPKIWFSNRPKVERQKISDII